MGNVISTIVNGGQVKRMVRHATYYDEPKMVDVAVGMVKPVSYYEPKLRIIPVNQIQKGADTLDVEDVKEHMGF